MKVRDWNFEYENIISWWWFEIWYPQTNCNHSLDIFAIKICVTISARLIHLKVSQLWENGLRLDQVCVIFLIPFDSSENSWDNPKELLTLWANLELWQPEVMVWCRQVTTTYRSQLLRLGERNIFTHNEQYIYRQMVKSSSSLQVPHISQ